MNVKNIRKAQELLRQAMDEMKEEVRGELAATPALAGVKTGSGPVRCATVSMSTVLNSPGLVLSPSYYLQDSQKEAVSSYLLADGISFETFQERLRRCVTEQAVTAKGDKTFLNPNTVATLERIQAQLT